MRENNGVEAVKKAIALLNHLSGRNAPAGVTEIAAALGIPKSTAHRLLNTLVGDHVVFRTEAGQYRLGPTVLLWGGGYRFSVGIVDLARPWLERLCGESRETLHLSVYEGGVAQYVDRVDSPQTVVLRWSRLGTSLPLYCTAAGRAILAALPPDELERYLETTALEPRTARTTREPAKLRAMLSRFRNQGYAEENEENEENIRCVGAAVVDRSGYPVAAISLTAPTFRFGDADAAKFGALLTEAARAVSARM